MSSCNAVQSMTVDPWVAQGGFIVLGLGVCLMFWGFSFICEEYCVPAITIFCKRNKISDDVAGAIFIGAGLSLPSMFSSFVGLFVAKSSIGVGTVIGGDIFNHFINVALSIMVSPNKSLKLDWVVLTRETLFYLLSILFLLWSAKGNIIAAVTTSLLPSTWSSCLNITWINSLVLVLLFVVYCLVETYFPLILGCLSCRRSVQVAGYEEQCAAELEDIEAEIDEVKNDPLYNGNYLVVQDSSVKSVDESKNNPKFMFQTNLTFEDTQDFALLKKSEFFSANNFGCVPSCRQWQIRYCNIDEHGFYYRISSDQDHFGPHVRYVNIFKATGIRILDEPNMEFAVLFGKKKKYVFRALDINTFIAVTSKLSEFIAQVASSSSKEKNILAKNSIHVVSGGRDSLVSPDSESVGDTAFIVPSNLQGQVLYYFILPLKLLIYYSTPDVKRPGGENRSLSCLFMCILWLAIESYILITSLSSLSHLLGVSDVIMGYSLGAWASSYPALWSSVVVARFDFGDMVVCNALGSNVFNNFIGLGVPWLIYILVVNKGSPYNDLQDGGVALALLLLAASLVAFYILLAFSKWTLQFWMVPIFFLVYAVFSGYLIYFSL